MTVPEQYTNNTSIKRRWDDGTQGIKDPDADSALETEWWHSVV